MPALIVRDLTVSLQGRHLVDGVSFSIDAGEKLALLGSSGSGKSLTAAVLLGQLPAAMKVSGKLWINGREVSLAGPRYGQRRSTQIRNREQKGGGQTARWRDFAAIHQNPMASLNPFVRLGRQLAMPLRNSGLPVNAAHGKVLELLTSVGIEDPSRVAKSCSGELSGGQLQRVCIAMALACRSSILVADEPTTALDTVSQAKVLNVLAGIPGTDQAMLFITHDLAAAERLCSRTVVLQSGRLVEGASMPELLARPQHPFTSRMVDAAQATDLSRIANSAQGNCTSFAIPAAQIPAENNTGLHPHSAKQTA